MQSAQSLQQNDKKMDENQLNNQAVKNDISQPEQSDKKNNDQIKKNAVHFFKLYKYSDKIDILLIIFGILFSAATGCGLPFFAVVSGGMIDAFDKSGDQLVNQTSKQKNLFLFIGAGTFAAAWISVVLWTKLGQRISIKCRMLFLNCLMKKKITFFQQIKQQQFVEKYQNNFIAFKEALGFKVGTFIFIAASLVAGGRNAISTGWLLSIIMVSTLPLLGLSGVLYSFLFQFKNNKFLQLYKSAEDRSTLVLQNFFAIKCLNGELHQLAIFKKSINFMKKKFFLYSSLAGIGAGWFSLVQFGVYALAFWFGSHCVQGTNPCPIKDQSDRYTPGSVIIIFFAFYVRLDSMQQILPTLRKIYCGMQAAYQIYQFIDSKIQTISDCQAQISLDSQDVINTIQFIDVTLLESKKFNYQILNKVSFLISKRLTGFSGSEGQKKGVINALLRFVDEQSGYVLLNGENVVKFNPQALRQIYGYIDSQSVFFDTTIFQNFNLSDQTDFKLFCQLLQQFGIKQQIDLLENSSNSFTSFNFNVGYQGRNLNEQLIRKLVLIRILLKKPKIIIVKQILRSQSQQAEFILFQTLLKLSSCASHILYFGNNKKILSKMSQIVILNLSKVQAKDQSCISNIFFSHKNQIIENLKSQSKSSYQLLDKQKNQKQLTLLNKQFLIGKQIKYYNLSPQSAQLLYQNQNNQLYSDQIFQRLFNYAKINKFLYLLGLLFSGLSGILYPIFTIFLADILLKIFKFKNQPQQTSFIRQNIQKPFLVIIYIGIGSLVINYLQNLIFSMIGQKITQKVRGQVYQKVLYLPINWFNSTPLATSFKVHLTLKQNTYLLSLLPTALVSILFKNIVSTISGLTIAFIFQWRIALLGFAVLPMMMISGLLLMSYFYQNDVELNNKYKQSSSLLSEVILNCRYIKTDNLNYRAKKLYERKIQSCHQYSMKKSHIAGIKFGLSQFLIFASFAIMFYFGSIFLRDNSQSITVLSLFTSIFAVIWPGWTSGSNFFRMPNIKISTNAANKIFYILDSIDQRSIQTFEKSKMLKSGIQGNVKFKQIQLIEPKNNFLFSNFSLQINFKDRVSLFSLGGSVTKFLAQLLLRVRPIIKGQIYIDGQNIKDYDLGYLRKSIGIINQNPFIFNGSLRQNIVYNQIQLPQDQIRRACKISNLDQLLQESQNIQVKDQMLTIQNLQRFQCHQDDIKIQKDRNVMSISHMQRVSITRIILKRPKIMLICDQIKSLSYIMDELIKKLILNSAQNTTCICCPHYKKYLQTSNKILYFKKNNILQWKSYKELQKNQAMSQEIEDQFYLA